MDLQALQKALLLSHDCVRSPATDHIKSYEHFLDHMVPYIIKEFSKMEIVINNEKHLVQFGDITVHRPLVQDVNAPHKNMRVLTNLPLLPLECRNRGLTYAAEIFVNIEHTIKNNETNEILRQLFYREVPLMQMPVMLRSKYCHLSDARTMAALSECPNDPGGYYISNGIEKCLQAQKVQRANIGIIKDATPGQNVHMEFRSLNADKKFRHSSTLYIHYSGTPAIITLDIPYLSSGQNICLIFRALGLAHTEIDSFLWSSSDKRRRYFESTLANCTLDAQADITKIYDALGLGMYNEAELGTPEKIRKQVSQQICGELLPHCGYDDSWTTRFKKLVCLRTIVNQILDVFCGTHKADNRDFEGYKTVQLSATLLSTMFRQLFSAFVKGLRNKMYDRLKNGKHLDVASYVAHNEVLTRDFFKAFTEGEVTVKQASNAGSAVLQPVHRINNMGLLTDLQKVRTPLPSDGKYINMRGVDATQLHSYCPAETPEGHNAGLLLILSLFAKVRLGTETCILASAILNALCDFGRAACGTSNILEPLKEFSQLKTSSIIVFVNGDPVAITEGPETLISVLRAARRAKVLPIDTSVIRGPYGIYVFSDMGIVQFPLICLDMLKKHGSQIVLTEAPTGELFQHMMALGIIEYVEAWEALDYRVAFLPSDLTNQSLQTGLDGPLMPFTHLALHPMGFLGTSAASVPWGNHDQAPRLSYQAGMLKQAISTPALNMSTRFDQGLSFTHWYPQRPMADTIVSESRKLHDWPMGENLMIAIGSYEGLSQEDAIVFSKASADRGSCRITVHKVFKAIVHKISGTVYEAFENPIHEVNGLACIGIRGESQNGYTKLDIHGLLTEGIYVRNGDVLIGRVMYTSDDSGNRVRRDRSVILVCEDSEQYIVEAVIVTTNREGFRQVRVKLRSMRVPRVGDKKSDRHGQKGVIGFLAEQWDLPYVTFGPNAGMTPDAIVNLHSINGRMTLGKLLEMLYSNLGLAQGSFVDASPYNNVSAKWAVGELMKSGYGTECYMTNGKTGIMMTKPWFIGSCFYQNLKHMVLDKIAARNRGPRAALTRQPVEGRAKQGGLRYGEMERDALLAHGASMALNDRFSVASDGNIAAVCQKCGQIGESSSRFTIKEMVGSDLLDHTEKCRVCDGPIKYINTTYCYSNLLVRELASAGIKIEHSLESEEIDLEGLTSDFLDDNQNDDENSEEESKQGISEESEDEKMASCLTQMQID